jgi:hypothetical protein
MEEVTEEELIGTGALEGQYSPYTFMLTRKSWPTISSWVF